MPRNSSGTYSLPSSVNPVASGTPITTSWANTTLDDIQQALTDSLDRQGRGGMLAPFKFFDGSTASPGASFTNETSTGFSRQTTGTIGVSSLATLVGQWNANGYQSLSGTEALPGYSFLTDPDTGLFRPGADMLGFVIAADEKMRLTAAGLAIGHDTPAHKLDVHSDVSGGPATVALFSNNFGGVLDTEARVYLSAAGTTSRGAYIGAKNDNGGGNRHVMTFGVNASAAAPTEVARLDSSGILYLGDVSTGAYTRLTSVGGFLRFTTGANALQFDGLPSDGTSPVTFQFGRATNTTGQVLFQILRGNGTSTVDHQFYTGTSGVMSKLAINGGYVNIGDAGPTAGALTLRDGAAGYGGPGANSTADGLVLESAAATGMTILSPNTSSGQIFFGDNDANAQGGISYSHATDALVLRANNANKMTISTAEVTMTAGVELTLADMAPTSQLSAGYRGMPTVGAVATANRTHCGKAIFNSSACAFNNGVFSAGDVVGVYNNSAAAFNLTQGAGVTMRLGGTTTTGTRSLAARGFATVFWISASECVVTGSGVT